MNSALISYIPQDSVITVLQSKISNKYDLSSCRILVCCNQPANSLNSTSSPLPTALPLTNCNNASFALLTVLHLSGNASTTSTTTTTLPLPMPLATLAM